MKIEMQSPSTAIFFRLAALLAGATLLGLASQSALALTVSGTVISNQASLDYKVGGAAQATVTSAATTFTVDKKIDLSVVATDVAAVSVAPGQTGAVTTFTVTNLGNDVQDFALTAANSANGQILFGKTDNFDTSGLQVFVENGVTAGYQPAQDIAVYIDELAAGASKTVYVLASIPAAQPNADAALVSLTATARVGGGPGALGAALIATVGANTAGADTVFADAAGSDDIARNADHSARDAYLVSSSLVTVTKTAALLCDAVNGTTFPKNIPGATIQYTVTLSNAAGAGASANLTTISDNLDANTTFDPNLVTAASTCITAESAAGKGFKRTSTRAGEVTPAYYTTLADADAADATLGVVSVDFIKALPVIAGHAAGELKPGESVTVIYNITIN